MRKYAEQLLESPLFKNMVLEDIIKTLDKVPYEIKTYNKGEIIAIEGDDCHSLGIILKGQIEIQKKYSPQAKS